MLSYATLSPRVSRDAPPASRLPVVLYLIAIVAPTLVVLGLGLRAVADQRRSIETLSEANRRTTEAAAAQTIENWVERHVALCLDDRRLAGLVDTPDWQTPEQVATARRLLESVARAHSIADYLFVLRDGEVAVPRVGVPLPEDAESFLARHVPRASPSVFGEFQRAAVLERDGRIAAAVEQYRRVMAQARSESVRALALSGIARCERRSGSADKAAAAYMEIARECRSAYNLAGRPQALVAATELSLLRTPVDADASRLLQQLRGELIAGRWEVSFDDVAYFLGTPAASADVAGPRSRYVEYLRLATTIAARFSHQRPSDDGETHPLALAVPGSFHQLFYRTDSVDPRTVVVVAVSEKSVRDAVLGGSSRIALPSPVHIEPAGSGGTTFRTEMFPNWEVKAAATIAGGAAGGGTGVFAVVTCAVLGVLVLGVVLLMRDVGRQASISRLRADLVGGVSHDLKTPLSVIRMYSEMLGGDPDAGHEQRRLYSSIIIQESDRLNRLVERVLTFSRVDAGQRDYRLEPSSLAPIVRAVLDRYRPYLEQQNFTAALEIEDGLPAVMCDVEAVSQAVLNLLDNAVKYSHDDRRLFVRLERRGGDVALEVEDRGPGIAPGERDRIFTRFYRSPGGKGRGGYGLGLYLVQHMIAAHGGRIELESVAGRGSLFRLIFPGVAPDLAAPPHIGAHDGEDPGR